MSARISKRNARTIRDAIGFGTRCPFAQAYHGGRVSLWHRAVWRAQEKAKPAAIAEFEAGLPYSYRIAVRSDDAFEDKYGVRPNGTVRMRPHGGTR